MLVLLKGVIKLIKLYTRKRAISPRRVGIRRRGDVPGRYYIIASSRPCSGSTYPLAVTLEASFCQWVKSFPINRAKLRTSSRKTSVTS